MSASQQGINYPPSKLDASPIFMIIVCCDLKIMQTSYVMAFVDLFQLNLPQYYNWNM